MLAVVPAAVPSPVAELEDAGVDSQVVASECLSLRQTELHSFDSFHLACRPAYRHIVELSAPAGRPVASVVGSSAVVAVAFAVIGGYLQLQHKYKVSHQQLVRLI